MKKLLLILIAIICMGASCPPKPDSRPCDPDGILTIAWKQPVNLPYGFYLDGYDWYLTINDVIKAEGLAAPIDTALIGFYTMTHSGDKAVFHIRAWAKKNFNEENLIYSKWVSSDAIYYIGTNCKPSLEVTTKGDLIRWSIE